MNQALTTIRRNINLKILTAKKNSPHIFFGVGVVGTVVSTVLACRATLKLNQTLDEIEKDINETKELSKDVHDHREGLYDSEEITKDLVYVYAKSGLKIVKLYAPAVTVQVISIGLLTGAHVQQARRNAVLMGAYAALQRTFENYRERVQAELGKEKELDIYHAADIVMEDGKEVKEYNPNKFSPYAKIFDEGSRHWQKDSEFNRMFVQANQNYANQLLVTRGHLLLNDVYDMLDLGRTREGAVIGWIINKDGDNFVDFGIYEPRNARFINGDERSAILDFNVDGVIYQYI